MSRMRLVCPNCGAQYEVPLEVIPSEGRDVQCSNCAHTWFQDHPDNAQPEPMQLAATMPDHAPPVAEPTPPAPEPEPSPPPQPDFTPPKRTIDPEMADLFREEREYEARQREADTLESQPDLGLDRPYEDEVTRRSREARERMAHMRGDDLQPPPAPPRLEPAPRRPDTPLPSDVPAQSTPDQPAAVAAAAAATSSRRDLLPDVEEINQTLRASSEPRTDDIATQKYPEEQEQGKGGFRKGLLSMIGLAGLGTGTYAFSPQIGEAVPMLAPYLDSFTGFVDQGRIWLDGQVNSLLASLDSMASDAAPQAADSAADTETTPNPTSSN